MNARTTEDDIVVPIELGIDWDVGPSHPTLVSSDWATALLVRLSDHDRSGHQTGIISWIDCVGTYFGWPNEEDLDRHPLYERGLLQVALGAGEVLNSPWVARVVHFPRLSAGRPLRHFVMPFNDTTFECLARDYTLATDPRPMSVVFADLFPWPNESRRRSRE